ncbi:hypothetical protein ACJJTC_013610 [Scirpophaga incertulas]
MRPQLARTVPRKTGRDKYLRPERFDGDPTDVTPSRTWEHWKRTFESFLNSNPKTSDGWDNMKLQVLINHVSPTVYSYISEAGERLIENETVNDTETTEEAHEKSNEDTTLQQPIPLNERQSDLPQLPTTSNDSGLYYHDSLVDCADYPRNWNTMS